MTPLFKKLNLKDQKEIVILTAPKSFNPELKNISEFTKVKTTLRDTSKIEFILIFVTKKMRLQKLLRTLQNFSPKM